MADEPGQDKLPNPSLKGRKNSRIVSRISLVQNADGSEKVNLMVIGNSKMSEVLLGRRLVRNLDLIIIATRLPG